MGWLAPLALFLSHEASVRTERHPPATLSLSPPSNRVLGRGQGADEEVHQPLVPAGQVDPLPRVAQPGGHHPGLRLRDPRHGGRAQRESLHTPLKWLTLDYSVYCLTVGS